MLLSWSWFFWSPAPCDQLMSQQPKFEKTIRVRVPCFWSKYCIPQNSYKWPKRGVLKLKKKTRVFLFSFSGRVLWNNHQLGRQGFGPPTPIAQGFTRQASAPILVVPRENSNCDQFHDVLKSSKINDFPSWLTTNMFFFTMWTPDVGRWLVHHQLLMCFHPLGSQNGSAKV